MKQQRDFKIGIKNDQGFFDELKELAVRIKEGREVYYLNEVFLKILIS